MLSFTSSLFVNVMHIEAAVKHKQEEKGRDDNKT